MGVALDWGKSGRRWCDQGPGPFSESQDLGRELVSRLCPDHARQSPPSGPRAGLSATPSPWTAPSSQPLLHRGFSHPLI